MSDNRLGNIGHILKGDTPRPRLTLSEQVDATTATMTEQAPPPKVSAPRDSRAAATRPKAAKQAPRKPRSRTAITTSRVPVRMDPELRDRITAQSRRSGQPLAAVAFDAIEAAHAAGKLPELVAQEDRDEQFDGGEGLFRRPTGRPIAQPTVTVELRMASPNLEVLDELVEETDAGNRTRLITAALRAHLTHPGKG